MLSHGLRRRKRRAWEAVTLLLAVSVRGARDPPPARPDRHRGGLGASCWPRCCTSGASSTRWATRGPGGGRCGSSCGLVLADMAIGLTYILLAQGLAQDYSLWQRVVHVVYGLVGVTGPVQFVPETRSDLFTLLTGCLGLFTADRHGLPVLPAGPARGPARPAGRAARPGSAEQAGPPGLARLLHAAQRQERHLVADRQVLHRLPGGVRGHAGRRRPAGRPGGLARGHPRVPRRGGPARLGARGDGLRRARPPRCGAGRAG